MPSHWGVDITSQPPALHLSRQGPRVTSRDGLCCGAQSGVSGVKDRLSKVSKPERLTRFRQDILFWNSDCHSHE